MNKKKVLFFGSWIAVLGVLVGIVNWMGNAAETSTKPPKTVAPTIDEAKWTQVMQFTAAPPMGDPKAAYTIVEFGDFSCPQCALMHKQFLDLPKTAPVNLYFVNRPFPTLKDHEYSEAAAQAGLSAAAQGKFWPMFTALYDNQKSLEPGFYEGYANKQGLDGAMIRKDVESGKYKDKVKQSEAFCDKIGMTMTPSIIVRDNKAGTFRVASGRNDIDALIKREPWGAAAASAASAAVAKGQ